MFSRKIYLEECFNSFIMKVIGVQNNTEPNLLSLLGQNILEEIM